MSERMTTQQLIDSSLHFSRLAGKEVGVFGPIGQIHELDSRVKVFEAVVWFPRLQAMVNATKVRGMKGSCRDIKIMTWCCAGRCLLQLERGEHRLTLITADDEKPWRREMAHVAPFMGPMGIQGIDAEPWEACKMLYEATRYGAEITLMPDENVSIG